MKSNDFASSQLKEKFAQALQKEDSTELTDVFAEFAAQVRDDVMKDFQDYQRTQDVEILTKRGIRQLTVEERKFYENVAKTAVTQDVKAAFSGAENDFPETVINAVMQDIQSAFPLLAAVNIQNTATLTKIIVNQKGVQLAMWGALGSKITKELEGAVGKIDVGTNKLTAFMAISKDMLDAGPEWMDAYVRAVLVEALGGGLCKGIIAGTGKDEPIGMLKSVDGSVVNGVYPDKTEVVITDLTPKTIGRIAKTIAQAPNDRSRAVHELLIVVNPVEYFDKIMPATTFLTPAGTYVNNVLPYPAKIVQDVNVPDGKAIFGLASRYFMGVGKGGIGGKIDFSDEVRFLDDERVYITKLYGNGRPLDDNAFVVADISGLAPANLEVTVKEVKGTVKTKEQA